MLVRTQVVLSSTSGSFLKGMTIISSCYCQSSSVAQYNVIFRLRKIALLNQTDKIPLLHISFNLLLLIAVDYFKLHPWCCLCYQNKYKINKQICIVRTNVIENKLILKVWHLLQISGKENEVRGGGGGTFFNSYNFILKYKMLWATLWLCIFNL